MPYIVASPRIGKNTTFYTVGADGKTKQSARHRPGENSGSILVW